jgi:protein-tyrosine phosphatase
MIDIHAHILPGLDDGPGDKETSLEMARIAAADGIKGIIATPHVATGLYEHSRKGILEAVSQLRGTLAEENIPLEIYPGAEYLIEPELPAKLQAGQLMTLNDTGKYLLIELPFSSFPPFTGQVLFEIMLCGVKPVLAHPERNEEIQRKPHLLKSLWEKGVLVQVTSGSITGLFGERVQALSKSFLRRGYVHFVASDAHSPRGRTPVLGKAVEILNREVAGDIAGLLTEINPGLLVEGTPVKKPPPVEIVKSEKRKSFGKFFSKIKFFK